jgi:hypothetical protein
VVALVLPYVPRIVARTRGREAEKVAIGTED